MDPFEDTLRRLREAFNTGRTRPAAFRAAQLEGLGRFLQDNKQLLQDALAQDLHKSPFESDVSELITSQNEVDLALKNLQDWMKDDPASKSLLTRLDSAFVRKEPFGLVLIIAPWNYPVNLTLVPLVGALAAGNCVVLKPSEISKSTEKVLAEMLPQYLDQSCFAVVLGGPQETGRLLEHKFDYIFFTGSPRVGKIIMAAATKHLTPVTLELGGKNPCYVDDDCDPQTVANRVALFRYFNTGQTCVAPDYILCSPETQERLLPALQSTITRFYGDDPRSSPYLGRIINQKQFQRLQGLLGCGRVAIGGQSDESDLYIEPSPGPRFPAAQFQDADAPRRCGPELEEIFGPILPIVNVRSLDEAIDFIKRREKPLALYAFSNSSQVVNQMLDRTSSGSFVGNEGFIYLTLPSLPLGGVGNSGMGRYHGKFSFDTFSHHRACLLSYPGLEKLKEIRYPPFTYWKQQLISWALDSQSCTLL
ncbi:PREDICTED: aldehyde dehydrogenase family 3 member B2-like [Galeopterus variegatus]|uniref:Aldehyde dehydrogenase n=1 Tax=Galeopterus variegatus TaxID=482537 RepID=A0ABM0RHN9_GALVR|nr:PREDICTED: aldehyde dehydrogenase family 3 member B2-like [Galeopterus variegatus]